MENLSVGVLSVLLAFGVFSVGILAAIWSMFAHYNKQSREEWNELRKESDAKWAEARKESEMKWAESRKELEATRKEWNELRKESDAKWAESRKELEAARKEWNDLFKVFIDVKSDVHTLKHAVFKKEIVEA